MPQISPSNGYVLTAEAQKQLHEKLRAEREAKRAKNAAKKERRRKRKESDRLAKEKLCAYRGLKQTENNLP